MMISNCVFWCCSTVKLAKAKKNQMIRYQQQAMQTQKKKTKKWMKHLRSRRCNVVSHFAFHFLSLSLFFLLSSILDSQSTLSFIISPKKKQSTEICHVFDGERARARVCSTEHRNCHVREFFCFRCVAIVVLCFSLCRLYLNSKINVIDSGWDWFFSGL